MLKQLSQLEAIIAGKTHRYLCENDAQIDHVIDALIQFLNYAKQVKDTILAQQAEAQKKAEAEKQSESVTDEIKKEAA